MPERYKDLLYLHKSGKSFKASGIITHGDNCLVANVEYGPEVDRNKLENEVISHVFAEIIFDKESFLAKQELSNVNLREPIPTQILKDGVSVNIN